MEGRLGSSCDSNYPLVFILFSANGTVPIQVVSSMSLNHCIFVMQFVVSNNMS